MAKKTFTQRLDEIMKGAKKASKDGTIKSSFSRKFYDDIAGAVMNDPDYEFDEVKMKGGEAVVVKSKPTKEFREKLFTPLMKSFNVDAEDAQKFIQDYQFTPAQASTMYNLMAAINWEYMKTGKILRLPSKEDFVGSINIREVEESVYENKKTGIKVRRKPHKVLLKRSNTPAWKKERIK